MPKVKINREIKGNKEFIDRYIYQYKELSRLLGKRIEDLRNFIDLFDKKKNEKVHKKYNKNKELVFLSYEDIKEKLKVMSKGRIGESIGLFCYLGLLEKVSDKEIPKSLLIKSEKYRKEKKYTKHIGYYSLPTYNEKLLNIANIRAKELLKNGFRKQSFSRKFVLLTFAKDKANEIFPQYEKENSKGFSNKELQEFENIENYILKEIEAKKYIKENCISQNKKLNKYWLISKKRILEKNNLECVYLTNSLKEKLNIENEKGRPKIIILKDVGN